MNETIKYVVVGGVVVVGVMLVAKAMTPQVQNTNAGAQSLMSGFGSILSGIGQAIKGKQQPADQTTNASASADAISGADSSARIAPYLESYDSGGGVSSPGAWSSMGDSSISDGGGYSRLSGKQQAPEQYLRPQDKAQLGIFGS